MAAVAALSKRATLLNPESRASDVLLVASSTGAKPWATGTAYKAQQLIQNAGIVYVAVDDHTSGATFAGDLAAHWTAFPTPPAVENGSQRTVTASTTITSADNVLFVDATTAGWSQPLPSPVGWTGARLQIVAITTGSNIVTLTTPSGSIVPAGSAAASTLTLGTTASGATFQSVALVSDQTNWRVIQ